MDIDIDMYLSYEALNLLGQIRKNWDDNSNLRERSAATAIQAAGGESPMLMTATAATAPAATKTACKVMVCSS